MEGKFGEFGGQYVPETLMNAVQELDKAYNHLKMILNSLKSLMSYIKIMQEDHLISIMQRR